MRGDRIFVLTRLAVELIECFKAMLVDPLPTFGLCFQCGEAINADIFTATQGLEIVPCAVLWSPVNPALIETARHELPGSFV